MELFPYCGASCSQKTDDFLIVAPPVQRFPYCGASCSQRIDDFLIVEPPVKRFPYCGASCSQKIDDFLTVEPPVERSPDFITVEPPAPYGGASCSQKINDFLTVDVQPAARDRSQEIEDFKGSWSLEQRKLKILKVSGPGNIGIMKHEHGVGPRNKGN